MENENLNRKLSLFYHPFFQSIVQQWFSAFQVPQNHMNLLTFAEINIRIQKVILNQIEPDDSLSSALTDWIREIESLTPKPKSTESKLIKNTETLINKPVKKMMDELQIPVSFSQEVYNHFFSSQKSRIEPNIMVDRLSVQGFAKFLFDLCFSWCEELDIELFTLFLLSLLYLSCEFVSGDQLKARMINDVGSFPDPLLTQIKLLKGHYQKYKKVDLLSYERFYEWNYLPNRLKEVKAKILTIMECLPMKGDKWTQHLDGIFQNGLTQITQQSLIKSTTSHFVVLGNNKDNSKDKNEPRGPHCSVDYDLPVDPKPLDDSLQNMFAKPQARVVKKLEKNSSPTIQNEVTADGAVVHTLQSPDPFIEEGEEITAQRKRSQLFPIWEHDTSEFCSLTTTQTFDKSPLLDDGPEVEDKKEAQEDIAQTLALEGVKNAKILRLNLLYRGSTPKGRVRPIEDLLIKGPPNMSQKTLGLGRTSASPKLLQQRRQHRASPDPNTAGNTTGNKVKERIENKLAAILNDGLESKQTIQSHRAHRKIVLNCTMPVGDNSNDAISAINANRKESPIASVIKYFGQTSEGTGKPGSGKSKTREKRPIQREISFEEAKTTRRINKLNLTELARSNEQSLDEEKTVVKAPKSKVYLDFQPPQENEARTERERRGKIERLRFVNLGKSSRLNVSARVGNKEVSANKEEKKGITEEGGLKLTGFDIYSQLVNKMKGESYAQTPKVDPGKTVSGKTGFLSARKVLGDFSKKEPTDLWDKVKSKAEKPRKTHEIKIKKINKNEEKKSPQIGFLNLTQMDRKRIENSLFTHVMKSSYEN